jgi:hypothetical protein
LLASGLSSAARFIFAAKTAMSASVSSLMSLLSKLAGKAKVAKEKSVALQSNDAFMIAKIQYR